MNIPNLASRYHPVRSSTVPAREPRGRIKGRQEDRTAALMKSRRFGVTQHGWLPEAVSVRVGKASWIINGSKNDLHSSSSNESNIFFSCPTTEVFSRECASHHRRKLIRSTGKHRTAQACDSFCMFRFISC